MAYLVLARKWRPRGFDAITGQEHVTRTLKNAITQDRVHHAFLFCGARGVGKTSAARVLARALNCRKAEGATVDPCGECPACTEIAAGNCVDVFEIDGASNRGIGEIRELRDGIAYAPQRDRFKVYIIDEVHMLTTEAFNALLKTLEEPPPHVKFIFATTEPHKIPVTILSRCQRFDFKRIPLTIMSQRLNEILVAEGVRMDPAGLRLVARESEGSMRDALSLLDRVISFAGTEASHEAVAQVLGVADRAWLQRLVTAALDKDIPAALGVVGEAFDYGLDLKKFSSDFVHHLRDAAVLQVAGESAPTDLSKEERDTLLELGRRIAPEDLQRLVRLWTETAERLVQASFPRFEVEMAVIRMCRLRPMQPLDQLLARLESIERRLESGQALPPLRAMEGPPRPKPEAQGPALGAPEPRPEQAAPSPSAPTHASPSLAPVVDTAPPVEAPLSPHVPAPVVDTARLEVLAPPQDKAPDEAPRAPYIPAHEGMEAVSPPRDPAPVAPASPEVESVASERVAMPASSEKARPDEAELPAPAAEPLSSPAADPTPEPSPADVASSAEGAASKGRGARAKASSKIAAARATEASRPLPAPEPAPVEPPAKGRGRAKSKATPEPSALPVGPLDGEVWETLVELIRPSDAILAGILDHARLGELADGVLTLEVAGDVTEKRLLAKLSEIEGYVSALRPDVRAIRVGKVAAVRDTPHQRRVDRKVKADEARRRDVERHPLVLELVERFGGTLMAVEVDDAPEGA